MKDCAVGGMRTWLSRPRQLEVVRLLRDGHEPPEIAERLGLSLPTLRRVLRAAYKTTGVESLPDLLASITARGGPAD